jgi:hypothetical protein
MKTENKRKAGVRPKAGRRALLAVLAVMLMAGAARAKDLGDILLEKGVITPEELREARQEEKQKAAAEEQKAAAEEKRNEAAQESRTEAILARLPKWLDRITIFGDVRTRFEGFYANKLEARNRFRLRARLGVTSRISDEIAGTVRLATGNEKDPISTNQTLDNTFTRKPINLDQAYLTLTPGKTFHLQPGIFTVTGGKFGVDAYRVSELLWDDDLSPEGATETASLFQRKEGFFRSLKLNAFQWIVDEVSAGDDPWMFGGQAVVDTVFGNTAAMTSAIADFRYQELNAVAAKFLEPTSKNYNNQLATSNRLTYDATGKITGYASNFNIFNANTDLDFPDPAGLGIPAGVFGDFAWNTEASSGRSLGFYIGFGIGEAGKDYYHDGLKNQGDWGVSYTYAWVQQDAVLSLFSYSDLDYVQAKATQRGSTNVGAHILRFDYELLPNLQLTAKSEFINALNLSSASAVNSSGMQTALAGNSTLTRIQLDAAYKF